LPFRQTRLEHYLDVPPAPRDAGWAPNPPPGSTIPPRGSTSCEDSTPRPPPDPPSTAQRPPARLAGCRVGPRPAAARWLRRRPGRELPAAHAPRGAHRRGRRGRSVRGEEGGVGEATGAPRGAAVPTDAAAEPCRPDVPAPLRHGELRLHSHARADRAGPPRSLRPGERRWVPRHDRVRARAWPGRSPATTATPSGTTTSRAHATAGIGASAWSWRPTCRSACSSTWTGCRWAS
jgi:hypothetical protein